MATRRNVLDRQRILTCQDPVVAWSAFAAPRRRGDTRMAGQRSRWPCSTAVAVALEVALAGPIREFAHARRQLPRLTSSRTCLAVVGATDNLIHLPMATFLQGKASS